MMTDLLVQNIREKYKLLSGSLNERSRRHWAAAEALSIGRGGVIVVVKATEISINTVRTGIHELKGKKEIFRPDQIRRSGGGRKSLITKDVTLGADLKKMMESVTRGDPESSLLWTSRGTEQLAVALRDKGHQISADTVGRLLKAQEYSLQSNRKRYEGKQHPDRDGQFKYIQDIVLEFQGEYQPVISVDTKKKELIGNFKNVGKEWRPKGEPIEVNAYDFIDKELGKAIPHGVYDIAHNEGWVSVGIDHDTAEFAVASIRKWWKMMGSRRYPKAQKLLITADSGGSNARRSRLWKVELQKLADSLNLIIQVCHFPPGTSKWNKIEHRMFSFITKNWRGKPLLDRATVINLIASTKTIAGLRINAVLDTGKYPTGKKISDQQMAELHLKPDEFHGEWNYSLLPKKLNN